MTKKLGKLNDDDLSNVHGGVGGGQTQMGRKIDYEEASQCVCEHFEAREDADKNVCGYCKYFQNDCTCSKGYYPSINTAARPSGPIGGFGL